jgi:hypothetical protein
MKSQRTRSRKQRMLDGATLAVSLTAFAYAFWPTSMGGAYSGFWGLVGIACALGSGAALIWSARAWQSPDDGRPYLEPDPSKSPTTRRARAWLFGALLVLGVAAFATALAGAGFGGATWWRALLFSISWPVFLTGVFGLVLALREGGTLGPTRLHRP